MLGLRFCAWAFSSCGERGPLFIAVRGPLTVAASLVAEHRLQTRRLSSCGSRAQPLRGMRDVPRPGLEPVSPALAGRLSTTAPPGKPWISGLFKVDCPPQCGLPPPNLFRAWIEAGQKMEEFTPFFPVSLLEWTCHLIFSCSWTGIYIFASLCSQAFFGLGLNYTTGFLGSPVFRWQIVKLLSPHNQVSQFLIITFPYIGIYVYIYVYVYVDEK